MPKRTSRVSKSATAAFLTSTIGMFAVVGALLGEAPIVAAVFASIAVVGFVALLFVAVVAR